MACGDRALPHPLDIRSRQLQRRVRARTHGAPLCDPSFDPPDSLTLSVRYLNNTMSCIPCDQEIPEVEIAVLPGQLLHELVVSGLGLRDRRTASVRNTLSNSGNNTWLAHRQRPASWASSASRERSLGFVVDAAGEQPRFEPCADFRSSCQCSRRVATSAAWRRRSHIPATRSKGVVWLGTHPRSSRFFAASYLSIPRAIASMYGAAVSRIRISGSRFLASSLRTGSTSPGHSRKTVRQHIDAF